MNGIHATAIVDPAAELGDGVVIGPYCVVGSRVRLGAGCTLKSHVVVEGRTTIGDRTTVFPFASIGHAPQDKKFRGEDTELIIGSDNVIREHATLNPGTEGGGGVTRVGDRCLLMVGSHVGHDCNIGNDVILVNNATLAGHVSVGDFAILGGLSAVHQFVRIGSQAMVGGMTGVEHDVIPFGLVIGDRAKLVGLNVVGLKRRGFDRATIANLRDAFDRMFVVREGALQARVDQVAALYPEDPAVQEVIAFLRAGTKRQFCMPADGGS